MKDHNENKSKDTIALSRRDFMKFSGMTVVSASVVGTQIDSFGIRQVTWGFLLVDMKKCQGCTSCMLACSLVHHGVENPSLSRIQVLQNPHGKWPDDLMLVQCRQCVEPACVAACPVAALQPDPDFGNVTLVDPDKCIGCKSCIKACPYTPSRPVWNAQEKHSQKCDLCAKTPYWNEQGGPDGKKACLEICPLGAIAFTRVVPDQNSKDSYTVNLRGLPWARMGFPGWDNPILDKFLNPAPKKIGGEP